MSLIRLCLVEVKNHIFVDKTILPHRYVVENVSADTRAVILGVCGSQIYLESVHKFDNIIVAIDNSDQWPSLKNCKSSPLKWDKKDEWNCEIYDEDGNLYQTLTFIAALCRRNDFKFYAFVWMFQHLYTFVLLLIAFTYVGFFPLVVWFPHSFSNKSLQYDKLQILPGDEISQNSNVSACVSQSKAIMYITLPLFEPCSPKYLHLHGM